MLVNLARDWFAPDQQLRLKRSNPHEMDDSWQELLPKGADIVDEKGKVTASVDTEDDKVEDGLSKKPSEKAADAAKK